tara:strand:- start:824 stop:1414 length:591 start_codon:yes stop_codon:yes gene_type:complete
MKLFNKWDSTGIMITDLSLKNNITITERLVTKSQGRNASKRFHRSKNHIVERLIERLMVPGHKGKDHFKSSGRCTGKYTKNAKIVIDTLSIVEKKLNQNPVQILVTAIENSAPREEITTIEYGGARYPQAVDCSPQRRIDISLRMMVQGAYHKSFGNKIKMHDALAEEIINAYKIDQKSTAIAKKLEMERMADAAR